MNIREADLRFLLPEVPNSVALLDASPGARDAWKACGVEIVASSLNRYADVVVARASRIGRALAAQPKMLILEGRVPRRILADAGYQSAHLLALPSPKAPRLLVPLSSRPAISAGGSTLRDLPGCACIIRSKNTDFSTDINQIRANRIDC